MGNSISNESIWGKLSEMDQKIDKYNKQEVSKSTEIQPSISVEEVEAIVAKNIKLLGMSNDSHFAANLKNTKLLNENILKTRKAVEEIQIPENINLKEIQALLANEDSIGVGVFKMRKTSLIVAVLGTLLFILTTFCMKLYSDSTALESKYYQQYATILQLQKQVDSLSIKEVGVDKKKRK